MLPAVAAALLAIAQDAAAERFEAGLARVEQAMAERQWEPALEELVRLLEAHRGGDEVFARKAAVEESARRCLFWLEHAEVPARAVVSGQLGAWDPRTGSIRIHYDRTQLDDFLHEEDGALIFPAALRGTTTIELAGTSFPPGSSPRIVADAGREPFYVAVFGRPPDDSGALWPAGLFRVRTSVDETIELDAEERPPLQRDGEFRLRLTVSDRLISATANGAPLLSGPRERGPFGRLAVAGVPVERIRSITLDGQIEPSWIANRIDEAVQEERRAFDARLRLEEHLPAWFFAAPESAAPAAASWPAVPAGARPEIEREWAAAQLLESQGEPGRAVAHLARIAVAHPDYWPARWRLVRILGELGHPDAAAELERIAADFPNEPEAAGAWFRHLLRAARREDARAFLDRARGQTALDPLRALLAKSDHGPAFGRRFEYRSEHYRIVSDIDQAICVEIGRALEGHFAAYCAHLRRPVSAADERFPVYLFAGFAGYASYNQDLGHGDVSGTAGIYSPLLKQLLIWNLPDRASMLRTALHEGFHQYLDRVMPDAPVWFNEGLAEYFERAGYERGRWIEGQLAAEHLDLLLDPAAALPALPELLAMDAPAFQRDPAASYALSWGLVHSLRNGDNRSQTLFRQLFGGLCEGGGGAAAARALLGGADGLPALEEGLWRHLRGLR